MRKFQNLLKDKKNHGFPNYLKNSSRSKFGFFSKVVVLAETNEFLAIHSEFFYRTVRRF